MRAAAVGEAVVEAEVWGMTAADLCSPLVLPAPGRAASAAAVADVYSHRFLPFGELDVRDVFDFDEHTFRSS